MTQRKPASTRTLALITLASGVVFFGGIAWISTIPEGRDLPIWLALITPAAALVFGGYAIAFTLAYWRRLDEAAREAHKWAWYWGGSLGIAPGFFFATFDGAIGRAAWFGFNEPRELIEFGTLSIMLSMIACYLVAWGVWWFRKR